MVRHRYDNCWRCRQVECRRRHIPWDVQVKCTERTMFIDVDDSVHALSLIASRSASPKLLSKCENGYSIFRSLRQLLMRASAKNWNSDEILWISGTHTLSWVKHIYDHICCVTDWVTLLWISSKGHSLLSTTTLSRVYWQLYVCVCVCVRCWRARGGCSTGHLLAGAHHGDWDRAIVEFRFARWRSQSGVLFCS